MSQLYLTDSQVRCLLAIANNPGLMNTDQVARVAGLAEMAANEVGMSLVALGLIEESTFGYGNVPIALTFNGTEAAEQVKRQREARANEDQLGK